jgi:hypothetical protein
MKLKFRVFDLNNNKYLRSYADNGESLEWSFADWKIVGVDWFIQRECSKNPTRFKVEQFSGLLDSQGTEVYEGDLVEVVYLLPDYVEYEEDEKMEPEYYIKHGQQFIGEVTRTLGGSINLEVLVRKGEQTPFDIWFPLFYVEQGKVVGNILTKKD